MPDRPMRFLHASDFHLEEPLGGLVEVPDHLRDAFLEAPWTAAQRVFDAALAEHVDFVVLSGDLLASEGIGPRGLLFLLEQFERLASKDIQVLWATGSVEDVDAWPTSLAMPDHVHFFSRARVEDVVVVRQGQRIAQVTATGYGGRQALRPAEFRPDKNGAFTVALAYGAAPTEQLAERPIDYWALGSEHARRTLFTAPHVAHYPGSPQGRRPLEVGSHGCTLVVSSGAKQLGLSFIPTDVVRWQAQRIVVGPDTTRDALEQLLDARMAELALGAGGTDQLVSWTIGGSGPAMASLRGTRATSDLLSRLRHDYGRRTPAIWSTTLSVEPGSLPVPDAYEHEPQSLSGAFLQAARELEACLPAEAISKMNLEGYLSDDDRAGPLGEALRLERPERRASILRQSALLGAELLGGEG